MMKTFKKLQTIFITSTISATILIGIEEYLLYQLQFSTIIIALLGGVIIGVCLSLFGGVFVKYTRDLRRVTILQVFSICIVSIIVSLFVILTSSIFPHENWIKIPQPPEAVEKFIPEPNSIELRVLSKTGIIYKFECKYLPFSGDDCTWQQDNDFLLKEKSKNVNPEIENFYYFTPLYPIRSVESYQSYTLYPDAMETAKFIRSEDGRIFVWHRMWNPLEYIVKFYCGLIIGVIIGILTNIAVFLTCKHKGNELEK